MHAAFTLNNLIAPTEKTKTTTDKSAEAPRYTGDELRRARLDDQTFSGLCDAAEGITGRALTEGQLRCLLTIYDYLGLDAGATIELLSYLKKRKGHGPHDRSAPQKPTSGPIWALSPRRRPSST